MKMDRATCCSIILLMLTVSCIGCTPKTSPPGPSTATGIIDEAGYAFHVWQAGLNVLLLHNAPNGFFCTGKGGDSAVYRLECTADAIDGRTFTWIIETGDGKKADVTIGGEPFTIEESAVFLIDAPGGPPEVRLIRRDLTDLAFDHESVLAFATADHEISAFLRSISNP
jgi:hypothetical protein